ncbi:hypothetical protein Clacol_005330 [Clathrus columnatus]|uniref:Uncharacterized protein n=1 Tax=Clathrus columnatus TaxID=1419009 RepID=A0AAV5A907_9AGAM|nr:hypothetical protein Clacol_005330 [Clathrus columnatus]
MADHNHSHSGPNAHSHGPQPTQQTLTPQQMQQLQQQLTPQQLQQLQQQQQQQMAAMVPDPDAIAALDARFREVPLKLVVSEEKKGQVLVENISSDDSVNFEKLNILAQQIKEACPNNGDVPPPVPPPQMVQKNIRSLAVIKAKEEGNKLYGLGKYQEAINLYTNAAKLTVSRPLWESSALIKEELAMLLSNRSAAYAIIGDWVAALADADAVINYKRPWSKGHFRKAKALQGLGEYEEAKVALALGLAFEPSNAEMLAFSNELNEQIKKRQSGKAATHIPIQ